MAEKERGPKNRIPTPALHARMRDSGDKAIERFRAGYSGVEAEPLEHPVMPSTRDDAEGKELVTNFLAQAFGGATYEQRNGFVHDERSPRMLRGNGTYDVYGWDGSWSALVQLLQTSPVHFFEESEQRGRTTVRFRVAEVDKPHNIRIVLMHD